MKAATTIEIPVAELKPLLPGLGKIIGKSSSLPVLQCVKVGLAEDHSVSVEANNLEEIVIGKIGTSTSGAPGKILVHFSELAGIVKKCANTDCIRLISDGKETTIRYTAGGTAIERPLTYCDAEEYPPTWKLDAEAITLDDSFKTAIQEAFQCASVDSSRAVLNGACLDVRSKEAHYVVGANGWHLYSANSFVFDLPASLIVPTRKFLTWTGFIGDGVWSLRFQPENQEKKKSALFRIDSDRWTYLAKPIEGEYPNWKQVVETPDKTWTAIMLGENAVKTILEAIPLLPGADQSNQPILLQVESGNFVLKAKANPSSAYSTVPISDATILGAPVEVTLNRTYFERALRFGFHLIQIKDSLTAVLFGTQGKTMMVMPLRPDAAETTKGDPTPNPSPTENTSAAANNPSPAEATTPTEQERKTDMPETTMQVPQRGNLNGNENNGNGNGQEQSAIDDVLDKIDAIKTDMRKVLDDLQDTESLLRKAVKEKKANEKEIARARSALRSLQSVEI